LTADLLIVGGNESACAAAVQAARLGIARIVLVSDAYWLGGQFSSEAVGAVDEWTTYRGKRTNFPRSGLFLEVIREIRAANGRRYGHASPGNAVCATETIEPAEAAALFDRLVGTYDSQRGGPLRVLRGFEPTIVHRTGTKISAVEFSRVSEEAPKNDPPGSADGRAVKHLRVNARLTIDASDWGDVIRLSGARYGAGPDLKSRFEEPSAPEQLMGTERNEMNPLSWCLVVREKPGRDEVIPAPEGYQPGSFAALEKQRAFVDSAYPEGIYSIANQSIYTHRRLVDARHLGLTGVGDRVLLNWPVQDYPLYDFPQRVRDELEATEPGASRKNIVDMTPAQRRIVYADAKRHSLGLLHTLQKLNAEFRRMELTDEFGTSDRLPPKPYIREGLRLEAVYMLREQDIRAVDRNPRWANFMPTDAVFGFQFNIDFHPTRRKFLNQGDPAGPWQFVHTANRNWHTDTDRAMFPLRGLVPVEVDGLLGGSKNVGVTSIVSSALRLHGQMMHVGQASATIAMICLRDQIEPRAVSADPKKVLEVQTRLVRGAGGPGVLLWPWHDLSPDEPWFEAANMLAVHGYWSADSESLDFQPHRVVTRRELARTLERIRRARNPAAKDKPLTKELPPPRYEDVAADDKDREWIESLIEAGNFGPQQKTFRPDGEVDWGTLHRWLVAVDLPASEGVRLQGGLPLTRAECVRHLWAAASRPAVGSPP
jgi:hypothetical protein